MEINDDLKEEKNSSVEENEDTYDAFFNSTTRFVKLVFIISFAFVLLVFIIIATWQWIT